MAIIDASYKTTNPTVYGNLTSTAVGTGSGLLAYSGFSGTNVIREPYSADLDFGTGEWSASAWVNIPDSRFGVANLVTNSSSATIVADGTVPPTVASNQTYLGKLCGSATFDSSSATTYFGSRAHLIDALFINIAGVASSHGVQVSLSRTLSGSESLIVYWTGANGMPTLSINALNSAAYVGGFKQVVTYGAAANSVSTGHIYPVVFVSGALLSPITVYMCEPQANRGSVLEQYFPTTGTVYDPGSPIFHRGYPSSSSISLSLTAYGTLSATVNDGTNTRTVTTSATYNTGTWTKVRTNYRSGRLSISVNGIEVASTTGAPLLTLNNPNAVLTIGNSYLLDAPFPGSLSLVKLSATVPTTEQSIWMYEQEKQMFRDGAQVTLPDATSILDLTYDDLTDSWTAVSASNKSTWTGLVRTRTQAVPAGSYTNITSTSGIQLAARSTTNPGVDITIPDYKVRSKVKKKSEKGKKKTVAVFDYTPVVFSNTTLTNGSNVMTCTAANVSGTPYIGMTVTASVAGLAAGTTITGIVTGTPNSYYLSNNFTGTTGSTYTVGQASFDVPVGYTTNIVYSGGNLKREGASKDYTRIFDGFRETILFGASPGTSQVQLHCQQQ